MSEQNVPAIWWYGAENAPEPGDWVGLKFDGKIKGYNVWYADVPKNVESFIMGKTPTVFVRSAADMNGDEKIDVVDIVLMQNVIKK